MTTPAQYLNPSYPKQILELVPVTVSGTTATFRVVYDGTVAGSFDANSATGIGYSIAPLLSNLAISLINSSQYNPLYLSTPSTRANSSGIIVLDAAAASFGGSWPNLTSLPGTILEFSIPYLSGPLSLTVDPSLTDTRFAGVIEYSDDARFPSLLTSTTSGASATNSIGATNDKFDYFSIVVPNGSVFDSAVLSSFAGTGSASYTIYKAGTGDASDSVVATGQMSSGASSPSSTTIGQNLLSSSTSLSKSLTAGVYTIKIENQSSSEVAYKIDFSSYIRLPELSGTEDTSLSISLPTTTTSNIPITWQAASLPSDISLSTVNGQSRLTGQAPPNFNGLTSAFSLTATEAGTSGKTTTYNALQLSIAPANDAPTLTTVAPLSNGIEDTTKTITYDELLAASNASDIDGDAISFRIESLLGGTTSLQKWNESIGEDQDVKVGSQTGSLLSQGESLRWSPVENANGLLNAFRVIAVDASLASSPPITVSINTLAVNDQPTAIASSSSSFNENIAASSTVTTLASLDPDAGDTFTYSLVSSTAMVSGNGGTDNAAFAIVGNQLKINTSPDYEAKSSYNVRLRTTDAAGLSFDKEFTFGVTNINEAPSNLTAQSSSFNENIAPGATVTTLTSLDPDAGDTFTYSLVSSTAMVSGNGGTDNAAFTIVGNQLKINASPDYEAKSSYNVRLRTADAAGLSFDKEFTFGVTNINEAPSNLTAQSSSFNENIAPGSTVTTLTSLDPDAGDTFTYSLVSSTAMVSGNGGTDNAAFTIVGNQLKINASPDYEAKSSYNVRLRTTDAAGLSFDKEFTFGVTNINEAPSNLTAQSSSFNENIAPGSTVTTLTSLDPDAGDTFTYSLVSSTAMVSGNGGTDNAAFTIVGNQLKINASPDYEAKSSYNVRLRTTDAAGLSFDKEFTFGVTNINEAPSNLTAQSSSFNENIAPGSTVTTLTSLDPDAGDTFTYSLVSSTAMVSGNGGTDNAAFTIVGNQLKINASPDYEAKSSYNVRLRSTDAAGLFLEKNIRLDVIDLPRQILSLNPNSLAFVPTVHTQITLNGSYSQDAPLQGNSTPTTFTAVLNYDGASLDLATSTTSQQGLTLENNDAGTSGPSSLTISSSNPAEVSSFKLDFNVASSAVGPFPFTWTLSGASQYEQLTNSPITISPDAEAFIKNGALDLSVFQTPLSIDTASKNVVLLQQLQDVWLPYTQAINSVRATALGDQISVAQALTIEAGAGDDTLDFTPLTDVVQAVTVDARLGAGRDTILLPSNPPPASSQIRIEDFQLGFDRFQTSTGVLVSRRSDVLAQAADVQSSLRQSAVSLRYAAIATDLDAGSKTLLSNQSTLVSSSIALDPGSDGRQLKLELTSTPARIELPAQAVLPSGYTWVVSQDGRSATLTLPAQFSLLTGLGELRQAVSAVVASASTATQAGLNLQWLDAQQGVLASVTSQVQISPQAPSGGATPLKLDFVASAPTPALVQGSTAGDTIQLLSSPTDQKTDKAFGGLGDDVLIAGDGDRLIGGVGADTMIARLGLGSTQLSGGADNDLLIGGANDGLVGGAGDDTLVVRGLGNRLIGGSGQDLFVLADAAFGAFSPGATAPNRILDFTAADTLAFNLPGLQRNDIKLVDTTAGTLVQLSEAWSVRLGASDLAVLQGVHGVSDSQLAINQGVSALTPAILSRVDLIDQTA